MPQTTTTTLPAALPPSRPQAALFSLAAGWQLRPHLFTSPRQAFEPDDIDRCGWVGRGWQGGGARVCFLGAAAAAACLPSVRAAHAAHAHALPPARPPTNSSHARPAARRRFELLICLDSGCQAEVLKRLSADRPAEPASYVQVCAAGRAVRARTPADARPALAARGSQLYPNPPLACAASAPHPTAQPQRICTLTDFLPYCDDEALLRAGSTSLLDRQLRSQVALALPSLRPNASRVAAAAAAAAAAVADAGGGGLASGTAPLQAAAGLPASIPAYMLPSGIPRPPLGGADSGMAPGGADEQWERMALLITLCCAGLVQYLIDCRPPELDDASEAD